MSLSSSPAPEFEALPSIAAELLALAPFHLPNYRQGRYGGDELCVRLTELALPDQTTCRDLYRSLSSLLTATSDKATTDEQKWQAVKTWIEQEDLDQIIDRVRTLGVASQAKGPGEELSKAMHDLRGGALSALLGRLQLVGLLPATDRELNTLFTLTRDHLKIMRNALVGLDEPRREADTQPKSHAARLIIDKWHESVIGPKWHERPIRMLIDCRYHGALTECCLESAAIDRIFYNLANNACRHAAGDTLDMSIFPVPSERGCLRFVLSNQVNPKDAAFLLAAIPPETRKEERPGGQGRITPNITSLFEARMSSTNSGFGLTVVADFVAKAFGLADRQEALRGRYAGAVLDGSTFRIWFHWPMADGTLPPKLDDFHQPEKSLSEP